MKKILILLVILLVSCGQDLNTSNDSTNDMATNSNYYENNMNDVVAEERDQAEVTEETVTNGSQQDLDKSWWASDKIVSAQFKSVQSEPLSTFSTDVDTASYTYIRQYLLEDRIPPRDIVRVEEMINYFDYNLPSPKDQPIGITTEIGTCPWNEDHLLAMISLQAKDLDSEVLPDSNIVFLLDVSGSMNQSDKLPLLKKGFEMLTDQLKETDRVSIVVYAGASGVVLEGAYGDEKYVILDAIDRLEAGGSTAGSKGIVTAYGLAEDYFIPNGNNRVILATDGDFNVGLTSESELIDLIEEKRDSGIYLSVLGFGQDNIRDHQLEQLADHGNGHYAYIDSVLEAKKVLVDEMYSTVYTLAKDVKIQVEFNPSYVAEYRLIGYENRQLENKDFHDDTKDAGEIGVGHTVTVFYEIVKETNKLKYQNVLDEWFEVRVRYKKPNRQTSEEITKVAEYESNFYNSDTFSFASAVAEFGLKLQIGDYDLDALIKRTKEVKGNDPEGYRAEFIKLMEIANHLK